jgi:Na+/proline symporter
MYEMVQNAYKVTLVSCIVPLAAGIFWRRASRAGAVLSLVFGLGTWIGAEVLAADATLPPQLAGLIASAFGMLMGSLASRTGPHPHQAASAAHRPGG